MASEAIDVNTLRVNSAENPRDLFSLQHKLGEGSFGIVYQGVEKQTGRAIAIKILQLGQETSELAAEIDILSKCDCDFIIKYYGSYREPSSQELWIAMELCQGGAVGDVMKRFKITLDEDQIAVVCASVLQGLQYLHSMGCVHRDIKAINILLTDDGVAKLSDFGASAQISTQSTPIESNGRSGSAVSSGSVGSTGSGTRNERSVSVSVEMAGTPYWMPPEVLDGKQWDAKADVWALGITAIELAESKPPLADVHHTRVVFMIPKRPPPTLTNPEQWTNEFNQFLAKCLVKDTRSRSSVEDLLENDAFIQKGLTLLRERGNEVLRPLSRMAVKQAQKTRKQRGRRCIIS